MVPKVRPSNRSGVCTVCVRMSDGAALTTDGPLVEAREHLGGFYVIEATDLDAALSWASKVTELIGAPIEVRPFVTMPEA